MKEFETKCKANWAAKKGFFFLIFSLKGGELRISQRTSAVELVVEPASREDSGANQISRSACENPALC